MRLIRHQHDPTRPYPTGYRTFSITVRCLSIVPRIYIYMYTYGNVTDPEWNLERSIEIDGL